jgi:PASTA domain/Divergent InlB B-repeat domain
VRGTRVRLAAGTAVAGLLACSGLAASPAAGAAISGSQITTPADPSFLVADETTASPTFAISGTTSGGNAADMVDVRCYYDGTSVLVAKNVALDSSGSFSVAAADLNKVVDLTCRLRAVPAGSSPSNLGSYAGPLIGVGERDESTVGGGPNAGRLYDYYLYAPQQTAAFDYVSLGGCGLNDGYLLDPTYALTTTTFYCNAGLFQGESGSSPTRSELQVDGANAYAPEQAESIDPNAAGLPTLSYSYTVDAHTGDLTIHETDPLVTCTGTTYPPTTAGCATFASAGVTDNRTITQDHDGHIAWIDDAFTSTDGNAHALELLWDNSQHLRGSSGDSTQVEYEFPGQSSFSTHAAGDAVSLPASAPGTILIRMHGAADGDTSTGQGAIVYDRPATAATFTSVTKVVSELTLHQTGTVPAGGSTRFRFAYVQAYQGADAGSLAQTASAAFFDAVAVTKSGKGRGTVTSSPAGIACGKTCSHGYGYGTSVTLKAKAARGSKLSRWSGACSGTRRCTFAVTGDTTVNARFVLRPCIVPKVVGRTLRAAKRALRRAYCSAGRVERVASATVKKGHVVSQKPKPHKHFKHGAKVRLVLSRG